MIIKGRLYSANVSVQIDVGFGDAITPGPMDIELPSQFDLPPPRLKAYPPETMVAEKFEAMIDLGMGNSRMKDFFDVWMVSRKFAMSGEDVGLPC